MNVFDKNKFTPEAYKEIMDKSREYGDPLSSAFDKFIKCGNNNIRHNFVVGNLNMLVKKIEMKFGLK